MATKQEDKNVKQPSKDEKPAANPSKEEEKKDESKDKDNAKQEPKEEKPELKIVQMKKGDYSVHILIEEVKNLISKEEELPDPVIKIKVGEEVKRTKDLSTQIDNYFYGEHFYFELPTQTVELLDSSKIIIEVYDKRNSDREDYIGIYEFDFMFVYNNPNHALKHYWIALANPESSDFTKIRGYLRLSASVLHESDDRIELNSTDQNNNDTSIALPPQIKVQYYQIRIQIFKAKGVPDMDSVFVNKNKRECNAYIVIKYMGSLTKTPVVDMKDNLLVWNQQLCLPVTFPVISQKICCSLWDRDTVDADDIIGSFEISIEDILSGLFKEFRYINVYGAPLGVSGKFTDKMNENSEIGSLWKGKVLIRIEHEKTDFPKISSEKIPEDSTAIKLLREIREKVLWNLEIFVEQAMFLPYDDEYFGIKFMVEEEQCDFAAVKSVNGNIKWNQTKIIQLYTLTDNIYDLGQTMVYLYYGKEDKEKNRICFQKLSNDIFMDNKDFVVMKFLPDPSIGKIKFLSEAGLLKFKLKLTCNGKSAKIEKPVDIEDAVKKIAPPVKKEFSSDEEEDLDSKVLNMKKASDAQKKKISDTGKTSIGNNIVSSIASKPKITLLVNIHQSRNLIPGDDSGLSDPYVKVKVDSQIKQTTIKYETINGIWNEVLAFPGIECDVNTETSFPIVFFQVYDKDQLTADDPLGFNYIWITDVRYKINTLDPIIPTWINLHLPMSNKKQGQLLVSFHLIDDKFTEIAKQIPFLDIAPRTKLFSFEVNILGLRDLQPKGILPVKKPFIMFDLNSIAMSKGKNAAMPKGSISKEEEAKLLQQKEEEKKATQLKSIKTEPKQSGNNPTINTVINFETFLPIEKIFTPNMLCFVYDYILSGVCNSMLGAFEIEIAKIVKETEVLMSTDLKITRKRLAKKKVGDGIVNQALLYLEEEERKAKEAQLLLEKLEKAKLKAQDEYDQLQSEGKMPIDPLEHQAVKDNVPLESPVKAHLDIEEKKINEGDTLADRSSLKLDDSNTKIELKADGMDEPKSEKKGGFMKQLKDKKEKGAKDTKVESGTDTEATPQGFIVLPKYTKFKIPSKKKEGEYEVEEKDPKTGQMIKIKKKAQTTYYVIEDVNSYPDQDKYMSLGFQKVTVLKEGQTIEEAAKEKVDPFKRHFRRKFGTPLEDPKTGLGLQSPFIRIPIHSGAYEDKKEDNEIFAALANQKCKILKEFKSKKVEKNADLNISSTSTTGGELDMKPVGYFKGLIKIAEKEKMKNYTENIQHILKSNPELKFLNKYEALSKRLLVPQEVIVRVYILNLNQLAKKDIGSESDPYIKIKLGDKEINDSKNHLDDMKDAAIRTCFELTTTLPGASELKIEAWDYDPLFSDDLIGETIIDIEDRYYDSKWEELIDKPIEVRPLLHPDLGRHAQGYVSLWVEIHDKTQKKELTKYDIKESPVSQNELRVIIWETKDIPMMDAEDTSDIYVNAFIDAEQKKSTDIHFRCQTGAGSFNWRMLFGVDLPRTNKSNLLNIQVYDKDLFSKDDFTCSGTINLEEYFKTVYQLDTPLKFNEDYFSSLSLDDQQKMFENKDKKFFPIWYKEEDKENKDNKFWLPMKRPNKDGVTIDHCGDVLVSIEMLPKWKADICIVGTGRDEPNVNPYLPPPIGRFEWSLNPFKLFNQCVGPKYRKKLYLAICVTFCIIWCIFLIPYIIMHLSGEVVNPFNYISKSK